MDGDSLYQHLKLALDIFNLGWNYKDEMKISFEKGKIIFEHEGQTYTVKDE